MRADPRSRHLKHMLPLPIMLKREFGEEPGQELQSLYIFIQEQEANSFSVSSPEKFRRNLPPRQVLRYCRLKVLDSKKLPPFTDAIHSDILTRLSQVSDLFVISRTSVRNFRGTSKLLPEIARELQVNWVLTGEVQEIGKQVKVSVRLVNAVQDRQVWAEIYQRELSAGEVFKIQSEITHNIIAALEMRLTSKEKKAIKHIPTETWKLSGFMLTENGTWTRDQKKQCGWLKNISGQRLYVIQNMLRPGWDWQMHSHCFTITDM
jgi:TolB-like protein